MTNQTITTLIIQELAELGYKTTGHTILTYTNTQTTPHQLTTWNNQLIIGTNQGQTTILELADPQLIEKLTTHLGPPQTGPGLRLNQKTQTATPQT